MTRFFLFASIATVATLFAGWAHAETTAEPQIVCVESEPVMVCSEPRALEQGSGNVKVCEMVRHVVCETVEVASK